MTAWTLILLIAVIGEQPLPITVHHIQTKEACIQAGEVMTHPGEVVLSNSRFFCVPEAKR